MDTDRFIACIKTDVVYIQTSNYELDRPLNKKVTGVMEDEVGRKLMTTLVVLTEKLIVTQQMMTAKKKKQKAQKSVT